MGDEISFDPVIAGSDWQTLVMMPKEYGYSTENAVGDIREQYALDNETGSTPDATAPSTSDTGSSGWDISSLGYGDEQSTSVASMNGLLSAMGGTTDKTLSQKAGDFWDSIPKDLQKIAVMGAFSSMASIAKQNMADKQLKAIADEKQKDRDFKTSVAKYGSVKPQSMQTGLLASIQKRTPNAAT